ncbi:MAG: hypothetical protein ACLGG5_02930 [Thermoleophilia bacterium]
MTRVKVKLGAFAAGILAGGHQRDTGIGSGVHPTSDDVVKVIRFYLSEAGRESAGWAYPDLLREGRRGKERELELEVDESLWGKLEREAERQDVTATQLLEHAVFYYAAELDAGRLTERILGDLK